MSLNCIQNRIQGPILGGQKRRKPLIYKGFLVVRETGLEIGDSQKS